MSDATLLFLPSRDEAWHWLRVSGDAVTASGDGLPAPDEGSPVIAIAPADAVTLHWAELPSRSTAQAVAAARVLVSEAAAAPVGELHVAVEGENGGERAIGVVAAERMRAWLAVLAANGVDARAVVPAPLLLPRPEEGYVRGELAGQGLVRGTTSGFADEARLTELVTGGVTPGTLGRDALDRAVVAAVATLPLDLRQGPFARRIRRGIDWALVRRLAVLGGLVLLATLAIDLVRIGKYSFGAHAMEARAEELARSGLPRGAPQQSDPARLLTERLTRVRGPGLGFSRTAAIVFASVRAVAGSEVTSLTFDPNGDLRVGVAVPGEAEANQLKARIEEAGYVVSASTFSNSNGRLTGELTVRGR